MTLYDARDTESLANLESRATLRYIFRDIAAAGYLLSFAANKYWCVKGT